MNYSATLTTETHEALTAHLDRADGQEDLCFALYRPSQGTSRTTAVVHELVLPRDGERNVHGNVAFTGEYLLRALDEAAHGDAGLALLHSHPQGRGWQGMSTDDIDAEQSHAPQARELTGHPLLGMTLGTGNGAWSARLWERVGRADYARRDCESVRVVGHRLHLTYNDDLRPAPAGRETQIRTVSAWGEEVQADLARLRVGIVGAGSVGSIVAEALARTGIEQLVLIDFDSVKIHNLDRLLHATRRDVALARSKVETLARGLRQSATAAEQRIEALEWSIVEEQGFRAALDCDVLFSCVDRPWPRSALNYIAYSHLIPVVDGGIRVIANQGQLIHADWKAHVAAPGRRCLECLKQYDPGLVAVERDGYLDDPRYVEGLPDDHPLLSSENVFGFSLSTASMEVLQLLSMMVAPHDIADIGAHNYHFVTGELDRDDHACEPACLYSGPFLARGDNSELTVTGTHPAAEQERKQRERASDKLRIRIARRIDDLISRRSGSML